MYNEYIEDLYMAAVETCYTANIATSTGAGEKITDSIEYLAVATAKDHATLENFTWANEKLSEELQEKINHTMF